MADLDDYALLEAAVDGKLPPPPAEEAANGGEKPRDSSRRDRDREGDRERGSKDKRHRSRSRDREHRSRDREHRSRDRSRERDHGRPELRGGLGSGGRPSDRRRRELTPPEVRVARERERELKELERATRTVFAFNLNIKATERDIWELFSKSGEVTDIRIITDRHTKKSKGLAYIEFNKQECVFSALALTGQAFMGQAVMVKPAEAEKNVAWEAAQAAKANHSDAAALLAAAGLAVPPPAAGAAAPLTLHVTGFPAGLGEGELRQVFAPFGAISDVTMVRDAAGVDSACQITFANSTEGEIAMAHWSANDLIGHRLKVTPLHPAASAAAAVPMAPLTGGDGELDDDEGGLRLDSAGRAALMSRLAGGAAAPPALPPPTPVAAPAAPAVDPAVLYAQGVLGPPSPIATPCLLLKNVWRAEQTAQAGWEKELTEDMMEELAKCGQLLHMHVDTASNGFVYVRFTTAEGAAAAHKLLNGRYYQGNQILADFQFAAPYNTHFGV